MRIENRTKWSTEDIRAIIAASCKARGVPTRYLRVTISLGRKLRVNGRARLGYWQSIKSTGEKAFLYGNWMKIVVVNPDHPELCAEGLPDAVTPARDVLWNDFVRAVEHEVAHLQGLEHKHMSEALQWCKQEVPWADGLPLRAAAKPDEATVKIAARTARVEHALVLSQPIIKTCSCGCSYTELQWKLLDFVGHFDDSEPADPEHPEYGGPIGLCEMRNCVCGSSILVPCSVLKKEGDSNVS